MTTPKTYSDMNPGRFIDPDKLIDKEVTLKIKDFVFENMKEGDDEKIRCILYFEGKNQLGAPLCMKVNKTNQVCLQAMFGGEPADAIGKRVTLYRAMVNFGREKVPAIRFRGSPDITEPVQAVIRRQRGKDIWDMKPTKA